MARDNRMGDHNARFIKRTLDFSVKSGPRIKPGVIFDAFFRRAIMRHARTRRIENDEGAERSVIMKREPFTFRVGGSYFMSGDYHRKAISVLAEAARGQMRDFSIAACSKFDPIYVLRASQALA